MSSREPVALFGAINVALVAMIELVANVADMTDTTRAGLTAVVVAWLGVASWWVRSKVTPVSHG